jgi:hypothetical protein
MLRDRLSFRLALAQLPTFPLWLCGARFYGLRLRSSSSPGKPLHRSAAPHMHGPRKLLRSLTIIAAAMVSCWLFVDAAVHGASEYQLIIAGVLMVGAVGLIATWFWSPLR